MSRTHREVGPNCRAYRDQQEDVREPEHPFHQSEHASEAPGYTHVVEATTPARIVYIAGQLGIDHDGKVSADFRLQAVQTFGNLKNALAWSAVDPGRREVQQLPHRREVSADLPPGARQLPGR